MGESSIAMLPDGILLPVNPVTVPCYTVRVQVSKEMGELTTQLDGLKVPWYTDRAINLSFVLDGYEIPKENPGVAEDSRKSKKKIMIREEWPFADERI